MGRDIEGTIVPEEEVAVDLGFKDVHAMRRWGTEQGQAVAALEARLRAAEDERDRFLRAGRRMQAVLERIEPTLADPVHRLAVAVVCGKAADWDNVLDDWWS